METVAFTRLREFLENEGAYELYLYNVEKVDPFKLSYLTGLHGTGVYILTRSFDFADSYEGKAFWSELWIKALNANV